jgi:nucleotide-binding universal stress UspA family protein
MTIHKILAAFDFSEASLRALRWGLSLAQSTGAQLEVVHVHRDVYDGRGTPELGLPWPAAGQQERYLRFLEQELKAAVAAHTTALEREVVVHVVRGDPIKRVLTMAEQLGADLLCMGSTSKSGLQRALLGSISEYTLRVSPVPVLVVH